MDHVLATRGEAAAGTHNYSAGRVSCWYVRPRYIGLSWRNGHDWHHITWFLSSVQISLASLRAEARAAQVSASPSQLWPLMLSELLLTPRQATRLDAAICSIRSQVGRTLPHHIDVVLYRPLVSDVGAHRIRQYWMIAVGPVWWSAAIAQNAVHQSHQVQVTPMMKLAE